jgi:hypothetical protein
MQKETVIKHFGSAARVARALGVSRQAVHKWPDLIPELSALRLDRITEGKLRYDEDEYRDN